MVLIDVSGANVIVRKQDILTSGMVGAAVVFRFDEDWNSLAKTAVFRAGKVIKDAIIVDSVAEIPHEVLATYGYALEIGVYGTADDGAVVIPTIWAKTDPIKPGTDPSGDKSLDPSLPVWAQMQEQLNSMYLSASVFGGGGLNAERIAALDGMFKIAAYTADASTAYSVFKKAFGISGSGEDTHTHNVEKTLTSISATYSGGDVAVGTAVTALTGIVVIAHYSDGSTETVTNYTLSGTIVEGSNTISVSYGGKSAIITVGGISETIDDRAVPLTWMDGLINNGGIQDSGAHTNIFDVSDATNVIVTTTSSNWAECRLRVFDSIDADVGGSSTQLAGDVTYIDANAGTNHPESVTFDVSGVNYVCVSVGSLSTAIAESNITVVKE